MKQVYIKHNNYFIKETVEGYFQVVREHATDFNTVELATKFISQINLNLASCELLVVESHESTLVYVDSKVYNKSDVEQCSECYKWFPVVDMQHGVIDRESGAELFCNECHESADLITGNQELDEIKVIKDEFFGSIDNMFKGVK